MKPLVRRDELEIGIEREYALYAHKGGKTAYLLACEPLLASLHALIASDGRVRDRWEQMQVEGWRIAPEYSHCLLELASPPCARQAWAELLAGFVDMEAWLERAAKRLEAQLSFDRVTCTARYSVRTDVFVSQREHRITALEDLLLDPAEGNFLLGPSDHVPPCFDGGLPHLLYAGFTSTNVTVHPPMPGPANGDLADHADALAEYFWHLLRVARRIELSDPQTHEMLVDGQDPRSPHPDVSVRDALIRWGDPDTAKLLDSIDLSIESGEGIRRFVELFDEPPSSAFKTESFHGYSCRPRVVENTMLFELRCFHSGLPLNELGELVDAAAALPTTA